MGQFLGKIYVNIVTKNIHKHGNCLLHLTLVNDLINLISNCRIVIKFPPY
jgi:hypothetical protein